MSIRRMSEMVRHQNPLMLSPLATVAEACRQMRDRKVGAVLVTDAERRLLGIFTGRDAVCRVLSHARDPRETRLADVMTVAPDCMPPSRNAVEALRMMQDGGYRHIPVVEDGRVVGIVSRGDFKGMELDRLDEETGYWERL